MNNKIIIIIAVVIAVVVIGGVYFLLKGPAYKAPSSSPAPQTPPQGIPPTLTPTTQPPVPPVPVTEIPLPGSTGQVSTGPNIVTYTNSGYSPNTLRVKAGTTVTFKNESSQSMWTASAVHPTHTVYSGTSLSEHCGTPAEATAFDACKGTQPGDSWSFKFDKVGTWQYHNHLNPSHTGTIVVE